MEKNVRNAVARYLFISILTSLFFHAPTAAAANAVDDLGRTLVVSSMPKRIISLAPNVTEILFSLSLGGNIVGVTNYCNYPREARNKQRIGGFVNPSIEKIVALRPDLIIATADGNRRQTVMQIEKLGIPVYVINPATLDGLYKNILAIARLAGCPREGRRLVNTLRSRQKRIVEKVRGLSRKSVFFQVGINPVISVGGDTFINELISLAGGKNIYAQESRRYPRCSLESILSQNPDIIIISTAGRREEYEEAKRYWRQWPTLTAVKKNHIFWIDPDLINRPSPRVLDALETLANLLHSGA